MRKFFTLIVFVYSFFYGEKVAGQATHVVISQLYGGGGNTSAVYANDFVELYNPTTSSVNITGWSVQYASSTGTSWSVAALSGPIAPGGYYLVKLASGGAVGAALPTADATNTGVNMSATTGKVALLNIATALTGSGCPFTSAVIDFVGYGSGATCFEGNFAPSPANTTALIRASGGCTDNNTNNTDFSVGTPSPKNSSSAIKFCGTGATLTTTSAIGISVSAASSGGNITADGSSATLSRGVVWNTSPAPATSNFKTTDGSGAGTFNSALASLNANTKYYYRAYAVNSTNIAYGNELNFTTLPNAPLIGSGSNISTNGFTANWTAPAGGAEAYTYTLEVDDDAAFGSLNFTQAGISAASLSAPVTGLNSSTTYYYRVKAVNVTGASAYSAVSAPVQTIAPATPTLSVSSAIGAFGPVCINTNSVVKSFTLNGADLDGSAVNVGALNGLAYAESPGGPFVASLSFNPGANFSNKLIYVVFQPASVQSYDGNIMISGGSAATISTAASGSGINTMATVSTDGNTVTGTNVTLNAHLVSLGCGPLTSYGFEYSTTNGFANGTGTVAGATNFNANNFSVALSGLTGGITYYYKAFATTSAGTVYGSQASFTTSAVVPVPMAAQPLYRYTENFSAISGWANNFISGTGANRFSSATVAGSSGIPNPAVVTVSSASFSSGTSGGVQKGSGAVVLLATGGTDNTSSVAVDFYMDFTGLNAGTLSFDWAALANSTGNRNASLRVYATVDGLNFTELTVANVLNVTNNVPASGTVNSIQLPAIFNNSGTARLRFYVYNGTGPVGSSGSRPKISIDNLTVTGVNATPCATPAAGATNLVFGTLTDSTISASFTAASPAPNEYLVVASTNSSLTSNPIDGQVYNVGDNVGDGDVIAKGSGLSFVATQLDGATTYYFFIFPVNSVCTGGPKYSLANVLTGNVTTPAGLPQCTAPADQASGLVFGANGVNTISGAFTAGSGNEYLVLQSTSSSLGTTPVNGNVYNTGDVLGNAKVVQRSGNTAFTANGLSPATTYYFYIFSLNSQSCLNGPVYNVNSPFTGSAATQALPACATPSAQPGNLALNATNSAIAGTFNGITNSNYQYLVIRSVSATLAALPVNNTDYNLGDNVGNGVVVNSAESTSFSTGGLTASTTYYFYVFAMDKNCSGGTKYLTASPLTGNITTSNTPPNNYYFGTLHAHSDYSDGNADHPGFTPTDDYNYALGSRGMDFLGISEHNHFSSVNNPGNELAKYHVGITEAANFSASHPGFLALYGMEWGVISGGGHVVVYGDQLNDLFGWESNVNGTVGPNYDVYVPKSTYTGPTGLFKTITDYAAKNAFGTLAHPNGTDFNNLANSAYDQQADDAISGVAVESGPAFSTNTTYANPGASMFYLWYYQKMLSKGYHLGPTIDHDNHNTTFGRATNARTAVIAPALTQTELMKAIHDMHFYATEDYDTKVDFTVNNRIMGSIFEDRNAPTISVNVTDPTDDYSNALIRVYAGKPGSGVLPVVVDSVFGSSMSFVDNTLPNNATGYYYIDITKGSTRTVTSPVWYTRKCTISNDLNVSACDNYTWNNTLYTTSTVVSQTYSTTAGCDSTVTLHLTINRSPVAASVTAAGGLSGCPATGVLLNASVNDGGNGAVTGYQWMLNGSAVAGATTGSYTALQSGSYTVQATNAGNCSVTSGPVSVTVSDNTPPIVKTRNITVALDGTGNATITPAEVNNGSTDDCAINTMSLSKSAFSCLDFGNNTVTLTVTDASGNISTGNATITVIDETRPVVITRSVTVALTADGNATVTAAQINNGSYDNCGISSVVLDKTSFSCSDAGVNTVTLTVTDNSGNTASATASVTVVDNLKPHITAPGSISVVNDAGQCGAHITELGAPVVSDNCGTVNYSNDHAGNYFPVGSTTVVWTAVDSHGNTSDTVHQTVVVIDNELPSISVVNINVNNDTAQCGATVLLPVPETADNCAVASVTNDHPGSYFPVGITEVHWTVTDANGLQRSATQVVAVTDAAYPVITAPAAQSYCKNATNNYMLPVPGFTDNCGIAEISYAITGATQRSGSGANASGHFEAGTSTVTWTITDNSNHISTASTTVTVYELPQVTIVASTPEAFCDKTVLTASGPVGSTYQWYAGSTPYGNTEQIELQLTNGDGIYSVVATANGCTGTPAFYDYKKQNLTSSYTILSFKDTRIGKYNKVKSGSIGVMGSSGEASFKSYSMVTGAGSFVKAPTINKVGSNIIISQEVLGVATVTLPAMQLNTASTKGLPSFDATTQNATVNGDFNNLTVKKGVSIVATGNTFGVVRLEEGASIRFTSAVLNLESLVAERGTKNGNMSYVRFSPATCVRVSGKVSFGSGVWVNPDNVQVSFYLGDPASGVEKFTVTGGNTKVTANLFMPNGKLKVSATDSNNEASTTCDHSAHTAAGCSHKGHDHKDCDHKAHNDGDCNDDVYMTGLFIAERVESSGNTVIWNSFSCGAAPAALTGNYYSNSQKVTGETATADPVGSELTVTVMPNPSSNYFTLRFKSKYQTPLNLRVIDAGGRVIEARSKLGANSTLQLGHHYSSGKYFAEVTQDKVRKVVQLIKGN